MKAFIPVCTGALLVLAALSIPAAPLHAQAETPTAIAVPLTGITIDGSLDDWPSGMTKYPILNNGNPYGPTDLDGADLRTSADLSPVFMVGYNQADNVIYLAVEVRDDSEIIGFGFNRTDACELYVEGTKEGKVASRPQLPTMKMAAVQLVACPTGGSYDMKRPGEEPANPRMQNHDIRKTKTRCAYTRKGSTSIYEWAIESFDSVPDTPTKLVPGKTIGFDIVLNDKDSDTDIPAWVCWGPYKPYKALNADSLGDIILADRIGDIGTVTGTVKDARTKEAFPELAFGVYRGDDLLRYVRADKDGKYSVTLLSGKYTLQPKPLQGVVVKPAKKVTIRTGKVTVADFTPKPIPLPESIEKCAAMYRTLTSYRDSTTIEIQTSSGAAKQSELLPFSLAFARPNKLHFVCKKTSQQEFFSLYSSGSEIVLFRNKDNTYMVMPEPEKLEITTIQAPLWQVAGSMVDFHFILSDNPLNLLLRNIGTIRETGAETVDGEPFSIIEITKPVSSMLPEQSFPIVTNP